MTGKTSALSKALGWAALVLIAVTQPASAQIVHLDDVVIDGSLCTGIDCPSSPSFGFDTIRLMENNLRIKFQDTSTGASFPTRDWQITANDSSNGGLNKFSIEDIDGGTVPFTIEGNSNGAAGVPSHSLYVESDGDIGLGTSNPVVELHVVDGDSPTLRLEQDGSSGFTPQTWDIAGNETNFFVRDVTSGSKLPFKILPNAPTNSLVLEGTTGDVGLGTQTPTQRIHVSDNDNPGVRLDQVDLGRVWDFRQDGSGNFNITEDATGGAELVIFDSDATDPGAVRVRQELLFQDNGGPPSGGQVGVYRSGGELFAQDSSSNQTQISPHDPETGEWVFFSKNVRTGKVKRIRMERLVAAVERLTGETFLEEWLEEPQPE